MPPVHSPTAPSFRTRRRHVSPTTAGLFPECPDAKSPKQVVQSPARAEDRRGSISDRETTDCPPASTTQSGNQNREKGPVRNDAAVPPQRANARLVGIARLAAFSPPAETRRKSAEKPEYFVLPVKSILNRCDSDRVPFEWTINPYRGCEFACKYCYARYTHEYMELDGAEFEQKIYVKKDAAPLLAWDVAHKYSYTSEATAGFAAGGGKAIARGRAVRRRVRFTADPWNYRPRWRLGSRSRGGSGSRRPVVLFRRVVLDAFFGEAVSAICAREVSTPGEAIRTVVCEKWLRSGRVPAQSLGARGANPRKIWISITAVGGKQTRCDLLAVVFRLGCGGTNDGTNTSVCDGIVALEGA